MRRPPEAPASRPLPPPRHTSAPPRSAAGPPVPPGRAGSPGPPPRRPDGGPGRRPAPARTTASSRNGGSSRTHRRRRSVVAAGLLTVVILVGYGGYTAWNAAFGGGGADDDASVATGPTADYDTAVSTSIFLSGVAIGAGLDTHLVVDLGPFRDVADTVIFRVAGERGHLEELLASANGERREVITSSIAAVDDLLAALTAWRDAVFNVRLASVTGARADVDAAVARLRADLDRWRRLGS